MQGHEARPLIAITMGDPAGIGAEVSLKALLEPAVYAMCRPLVVGTLAVLEQMRDVLHSGQHLHPVVSPAEGRYAPGTVAVLDLSAEHPGPFPLGVAGKGKWCRRRGVCRESHRAGHGRGGGCHRHGPAE